MGFGVWDLGPRRSFVHASAVLLPGLASRCLFPCLKMRVLTSAPAWKSTAQSVEHKQSSTKVDGEHVESPSSLCAWENRKPGGKIPAGEQTGDMGLSPRPHPSPVKVYLHSFNDIEHLLGCKHCVVGMRRWDDIKCAFEGHFHLIISVHVLRARRDTKQRHLLSTLCFILIYKEQTSWSPQSLFYRLKISPAQRLQ